MPDPVARHTAELSELMRHHLRIKGRDFRAQVRRAGRLLPRRIRRDAKTVLEAERHIAHPRLSRQVNLAEVDAAAARIAEYLRAIDPAERRKDRILWVLAKVSALGIALFIALVWYAWDRGLI